MKCADGSERRVPKTVALLAIRRGEADLSGPRQIIERAHARVQSSDPNRFNKSAHVVVGLDPAKALKRERWRASHGLLVRYPIKDQRSRSCQASLSTVRSKTRVATRAEEI